MTPVDLTVTQEIPASNRNDARELVARMNARRAREEQQRTQVQLIEDIEAGIRVLNNPVHGHNIPEAEINERARALVTMLLGNYSVERLP